MKHRIYKTTLVILILGIYLFLLTHFRLNYNSFGTYDYDFNLVNANEIKDYKEKNILNNKVTKEATHIFTVENIKILIFEILMPIGIFYFFVLTKRGREIIKNIKIYFNNKSIALGINDAYNKGNKELLAKKLLDNALMSASSTDTQKKLTGIQRLSQFTEDKALFGLIGILANENDISFVYCIIRALNSMIKKRIKNNEI